MDEKWMREALFYAGLLHELFLGQVPKKEVGVYLRAVASKAVLFPNGKTKKPSLSTLWRKWRAFQEKGVEGLRRKTRSDKGGARALEPEVLETALQAKREEPLRTVSVLNDLLLAKHQIEVKRSTLYRHLKAHGATRMRLGAVSKPVRKRWTSEIPNGMWVGDVAHGPLVLVNGVTRKSYLSAFIDAHSRVLVAGRYYLDETFDILIDTLLRGFMLYSLPRAIYLDNAKIYWAGALRLACYQLKIDLLHRPVRDPAPGGVIERFFQTVQGQFEVEARLEETLTLERLNTTFHAWLEEAYHRRVHSEIGMPPLEKYGTITPIGLDLSEVRAYFHRHETRVVNKVFSDIRLHGRFYRVDHKLRGSRVDVRYDPFGDVRTVKIHAIPSGAYLGTGTLHQREEGERIETPPRRKLPSSPVLDALTRKQAERRKDEDFRPIATKRPWPLSAFLNRVAELLGRQAGVSAFSEEEMRILSGVHARHPELTRKQLAAAAASVDEPTLVELIHALEESL